MQKAHPLRVLLIEDDELIAHGVVTGLRAHGLTVDAVAMASLAEAALSTVNWHVVVLDLDLPDEDGTSLWAGKRTLDGNVQRCIALVGHGRTLAEFQAIMASVKLPYPNSSTTRCRATACAASAQTICPSRCANTASAWVKACKVNDAAVAPRINACMQGSRSALLFAIPSAISLVAAYACISWAKSTICLDKSNYSALLFLLHPLGEGALPIHEKRDLAS